MWLCRSFPSLRTNTIRTWRRSGSHHSSASPGGHGVGISSSRAHEPWPPPRPPAPVRPYAERKEKKSTKEPERGKTKQKRKKETKKKGKTTAGGRRGERRGRPRREAQRERETNCWALTSKKENNIPATHDPTNQRHNADDTAKRNVRCWWKKGNLKLFQSIVIWFEIVRGIDWKLPKNDVGYWNPN